MKHKVLYNASHGMFSYSGEFITYMTKEYGKNPYVYDRHDPLLIQVVEEYGLDLVADDYCRLAIEEIDGNQYRISEYDNKESVITPETDNIEWITID